MNFFQEIDDDLEKLLLIEDEDKRRLVREWLEKSYIPLKNEYIASLTNIEARLFDRCVIKDNLTVVTSIVDKKHYDNTSFFRPINIEDIDDINIDTRQLIESIQEGNTYRLYSVYFDDSYEELVRILQRKIMFDITAYTEYGAYKGKATLKASKRYDEQLRNLYEVFINNGVSWSPVNICYIKRMLDMEVVSLNLPMADEIIEKIEVDFGEYKDMLKPDMIPLWNIDTEQVTTSVYPVETPDGRYYSHVISAKKLEEDSNYLVTGDCYIQDVERTLNKDLEINCDARRPIKWELWKFSNSKNIPAMYKEYRRNKTITGIQAVNTLGETIRYVNTLGIEGMTLLNVTMDAGNDNLTVPTYDMDYFIYDKIGAFDNSPVMYLEWKLEDIHNKWNIDQISYVTTCLSKVYAGYRIENRWS